MRRAMRVGLAVEESGAVCSTNLPSGGDAGHEEAALFDVARELDRGPSLAGPMPKAGTRVSLRNPNRAREHHVHDQQRRGVRPGRGDRQQGAGSDVQQTVSVTS